MAISFIKEYIIYPAERFLVGDLRRMLRGRSTILDKDDTDFAICQLGLLGNVAKWKPQSPQELAQVLGALDQQPHGRAGYRGAEILTDSSAFLLADTSPAAHAHRFAVQRHLKPHAYADLTWDLLKNEKITHVSTKRIATGAIAKQMLGIEPSTLVKYKRELDSLSDDFQTSGALIAIIPPSILRWILRDRRSKHTTWVEELLFDEIKRIKQDPQCSGLLAEEIRKRIDSSGDVDLHKDPDLKSLILLLLAIPNLDQTLVKLYSYLEENRDTTAYNVLETEIREAQVVCGDGIDPQLLLNTTKMPALEELFQHCVQTPFRSHPIAIRYAQHAMNCGTHAVPNRTLLLIRSPHEQPPDGCSLLGNRKDKTVPSSAFSVGNRICPGRLVAAVVFKTIAVKIITSGSLWIKPFKNSLGCLSDKIQEPRFSPKNFAGRIARSHEDSIPSHYQTVAFQAIDKQVATTCNKCKNDAKKRAQAEKFGRELKKKLIKNWNYINDVKPLVDSLVKDLLEKLEHKDQSTQIVSTVGFQIPAIYKRAVFKALDQAWYKIRILQTDGNHPRLLMICEALKVQLTEHWAQQG